ncbi:hypothetical protein Emed_000148 [Eimeria media]
MAAPIPLTCVSFGGLAPRLLVRATRRMHSAAAAAASAAPAASCADRIIATSPCCSCCGVRPIRHLQRMPSRGSGACRLLHTRYAGDLAAAVAAKAASPIAAAATAAAVTATTAARAAAATPPAGHDRLSSSLLLLLQRPVLLEQRRQLHRSHYLLHPGKQQQQQQGDAAEAAPSAAVDGATAAKETVEAASAGVSPLPSQDSQAPLQLRAAFAPQPPKRPPEERRRWSTWWKVCLFLLGTASPFVAAAVIFRALLQQRQQQHEVAQLATADVEEALKAAQRRAFYSQWSAVNVPAAQLKSCCWSALTVAAAAAAAAGCFPGYQRRRQAEGDELFVGLLLQVVVGGATCILLSASESSNRFLAGRVDPHLPETRVLRLPKEEVISGIPNNALTHLIAGRRSPVSLPFNFVHLPLRATSEVARQIKEGQKLQLALLYVDPHSGDSVMLSGVAAAVDVSAYKSYYWKTSWGALFPGGSMSPDYELIKFVPSSISIDLSAAGAPIRLSRVVTEDSIFWAFENACSDGSTHADKEQQHAPAAAGAAALS